MRHKPSTPFSWLSYGAIVSVIEVLYFDCLSTFMLPIHFCLLPCQVLARRGAIALTVAVASSMLTSVLTSDVAARPVPDDSLGTRVVRQNDDFLIEGGTRRRRNLFHSFREFDIEATRAVFFNGAGVENIFSRVTGGNGSTLDGTLGVINSDANLFLMNPQGIVFGPDAQLDLRGSLVATTADQIQFGNRGRFRANTSNNPSQTLTIDPTAFIFNRVNGAPDIGDRRIVNLAVTDTSNPALPGGLRISRGRSLLMLGGDVEFDGGYASAERGRVQIGGLSEPGRVELETRRNGRELRLNFVDDAMLANLTFGNGSVVDVMGDNRGDIALTGRDIAIVEGSSICAGIGSPLACARPEGADDLPTVGSDRSQAGNIVISASGAVRLNSGGSIFNNVRPNGVGNSIRDIREAVALFVASDQDDNTALFGSVIIAGQNIEIEAPSSIVADTFGQGNAGLVYLLATEQINIVGQTPADPLNAPIVPLVNSSVNIGGVGDAGGILAIAPIFTLSNFAAISSSTFGVGNPGTVEVIASVVSLSGDSVIFSTIEAGGVATRDIGRNARSSDEGAIFITANVFELRDGSQLQTLVREPNEVSNAPAGEGDAGNIVVTAERAIIDGRSPLSRLQSAIFSSVGPEATGDGGFIFLNTGDLLISNEGQINAETFGRNSAGGNVFVLARDSMLLDNNAGITVSAAGDNTRAGNIAVVVGDDALLGLNQGSFLTAQTTSGDGGNMVLGGNDFLILLNGSDISTTAGTAEAGGDGGNIELGFGAAILGEPFRDNNITAQAFDGDGGNITTLGNAVNLLQIQERPDDFLTSNDITASSEFGADGVVTINELDVDPVRGIVELPDLIVDPNQLLVQACPGPGQSTDEMGAFYVTGRGGIPPAPGELGRGNAVNVPWVSPPEEATGDDWEESQLDASNFGESRLLMSHVEQPSSSQIEAQDWVEDENGDIWLVTHSKGTIAPPAMPDLCISTSSASFQPER